VINNPFWWSADDKFSIILADTLGVPLPNTRLLPSAEHPTDTSGKSFRNLISMDWEGIFDYIKFPIHEALCRWWMEKRIPFRKQRKFWEKHQETGQLVMMLQEIVLLNILECIASAVKRLESCNTNKMPHLRYV
jgi:hypothetical protein